MSVHRKYTNFYVLLMSLSTLKLPRYKLAISKSVLVNSTGHMLESGEHPTKYVKGVFCLNSLLFSLDMLTLMLPIFFGLFFIDLRLELLTQFPAPNDEK